MKNKTKPVSRQKKQSKTPSKKIQSPKIIYKRKPLTALYWQSSLDAVSDAVCFLDNDQRILHCNRAMTEMFGLTQKEIIGKHCWEIVHGTTKPISKCPAARTKKSLVRENGEISKGDRWLNILADPILDKKGRIKGLVHTIQDITEHKRTVQSLQESENKYRELLENVSEVIFSVDIHGCITYISPAMEHLTGYSINEILGTNISKHVIPEDLPVVQASINRILSGGQKESIEYRVKIKNGKIRHLVSSSNVFLKDGHPAGLSGVITDITQRIQVEQSLKEAELKFRTIFDSASDGILLADTVNRKFISANKKICAILGYTRNEILKLNVSDIHPQESLPYVIDQFEKLAREEIAIAHDIPVMKKDKTVFFVDVNSSFIYLSGKECLMGIFRDVSERKQLEKALKERDIVFKKLSANVPGIIYQFMMKPDGTYCVPFSTGALQDIYGCFPEDVVNDFSPIIKVVYHEDIDRFISSIKLSARNMSRWQCEYRVQVPGKPLRWILGTSTPEKLPDGSILWHGFNADITERKKSEELLLLIKKAVESSSDAIGLSDPQGHHFYHNEAFTKLFEYTPAELEAAGGGPAAFADKKVARDVFASILSGKSWTGEVEIISKTGRKMTVLERADAIKDESGIVIGFVGIHTDITEHKRIGSALRKEQLFSKSVLDNLPGIFYLFTYPECRLVLWNKQHETLLGFNAEEMKGRHVTEWFAPENREALLKAVDEVMEKGQSSLESYLVAKDGRQIPFFLPGVRFEADGRSYFMGIGIDLTERKKAEKELQESEELFRNLFQHHAAIKLIIDPDTGSIMDANEAAVKYYGWSHEQITHMRIQDINTRPPEEVKIAIENVKSRKRTNFEFSHRRADGSVRDVDIFSTNIRVQGKEILHTIVYDITERKQAENVIIRERDFSQAAFDSLPGLAYLIDEEGHIIRRNKNFAAITGYSDEEVSRMSPLDFFSEPEKELAQKAINNVFATGHALLEAPVMAKDGTAKQCLITGNLLFYDGKPCLIGTAIDISERKKAEEELEKYRQHLEDLVRERTIILEASNKELEAFSYSASHDLRAPIRVIEGFSQALLEDYDDKLDIQGKDYLTRIKTATKKMADLIEDMLQLSRITRMEMNIENIDLSLIARSVISELQKSQPQRQVEIIIAEGLENKADSRLMRIMLINLLSNAWKFTEKQAKALIEFGLLQMEGAGKIFFIRDNGAGFDMAYADKLFTPFQRLHTDEEFPGTGIGLATVRRIINRHGGRIWAEGGIDKGATFYFTINEK